MINQDNLDKVLSELSKWITEYFNNIENYPVKSQCEVREIYNKLPGNPPRESESFDAIFDDFNKIIMPGITHWQSPKFFAYFPANSSYPSLAAEIITAALGAQCMKWETSPAAAELEEMVMNWLRDMIGLPEDFTGVIQDTASTSTLASIINAREFFSQYNINKNGFAGNEKFRVYCSTEAHSSIEKAIKIAGIGRENLVKIPVNADFSMNTSLLEKAITDDTANGYRPLCVVAALGTTGSTAVDSLEEIAALKRKYKFWLHVDAAFMGSLLLLPEKRGYLKGVELADTFVFNPHKWMFTNFDCSAYFVKDKNSLLNTFEIIPEYLKTRSDSKVNNYCDWGIPLGRRFRALKLWFVIRSFGVKGLQEKIRYQLKLAEMIYDRIDKSEEFEILAPLTANLVCFRFKPKNRSEEELNSINENLMQRINDSGKMYISHTKLNGKYTLRMVIAQAYVEEKHITEAWKLLNEFSKL
ncbi:MAG: pyridoxal-dependent decarboxylase [Ignavibacteria bacterium]|nr:pyridoxal-dependent decarboxylase [Ignavibacteria bacterium]